MLDQAKRSPVTVNIAREFGVTQVNAREAFAPCTNERPECDVCKLWARDFVSSCKAMLEKALKRNAHGLIINVNDGLPHGRSIQGIT